MMIIITKVAVGINIVYSSVKIFRIPACMFIFGKLPSGRGSSQFFNIVSTPRPKNSFMRVLPAVRTIDLKKEVKQ